MRKKLILATLLLLFASLTFAQSNHMNFMGIPITGNADALAKKLIKEKGFVLDNDNQTEHPTLFGRFAGHDRCMIIIVADKNGNAFGVGVIFPIQDSWPLLYGNYSSIKSNLTTKYGEPDSTERFETTIEPTDDFDRMHQTRMGRCKYNSTFYTDEGKVTLSINNVQTNCYVYLLYHDRENSIEATREAIDDL